MGRFQTESTSKSGTAGVSHSCLAKLSFFKGRDPALIEALTEYLELEVFVEGTSIMKVGEIGEKMYFLSRGEVEVLVGPDLTRVATLGAGSVFGEGALIGNAKRTATVRAIEFCDCRSVHRHAFQTILKSFPVERKYFEQMYQDRVNDAKEKSEEKASEKPPAAGEEHGNSAAEKLKLLRGNSHRDVKRESVKPTLLKGRSFKDSHATQDASCRAAGARDDRSSSAARAGPRGSLLVLSGSLFDAADKRDMPGPLLQPSHHTEGSSSSSSSFGVSEDSDAERQAEMDSSEGELGDATASGNAGRQCSSEAEGSPRSKGGRLYSSEGESQPKTRPKPKTHHRFSYDGHSSSKHQGKRGLRSARANSGAGSARSPRRACYSSEGDASVSQRSADRTASKTTSDGSPKYARSSVQSLSSLGSSAGMQRLGGHTAACGGIEAPTHPEACPLQPVADDASSKLLHESLPVIVGDDVAGQMQDPLEDSATTHCVKQQHSRPPWLGVLERQSTVVMRSDEPIFPTGDNVLTYFDLKTHVPRHLKFIQQPLLHKLRTDTQALRSGIDKLRSVHSSKSRWKGRL